MLQDSSSRIYVRNFTGPMTYGTPPSGKWLEDDAKSCSILLGKRPTTAPPHIIKESSKYKKKIIIIIQKSRVGAPLRRLLSTSTSEFLRWQQTTPFLCIKLVVRTFSAWRASSRLGKMLNKVEHFGYTSYTKWAFCSHRNTKILS